MSANLQLAINDLASAPDFLAGCKAAQAIWNEWDEPGFICPQDPLTPGFANGALAEYEKLQKDTMKGLMRKLTRGAMKGAQQLNVSKWHGVIEVIQNADDLRATEIILAIRMLNGKQCLLLYHNGAPVQVQHVAAMTYAFCSTKTDDPEQSGRFGVGMKTLGRLGQRLEVHSGPYPFSIDDLHIKAEDPLPEIPGLYAPGPQSTLLALQLNDGFANDEFITWLESLDASLLLFLKTVRKVSCLIEGREPINLILREEQPSDGMQMPPGINRLVLGTSSEETFIRYSTEVSVPAGLARSDKATGEKTTVAIATSASTKTGSIHATLPTKIETSLPFIVNADFDPGTSRENLLDTAWNEWLLEQIGKLAAEVIVHLLKVQPAKAWEIIPLKRHARSNDQWLMAHFVEMQAKVHEHIAQNGTVWVNGSARGLASLSFETTALTGTLEPEDYAFLAQGTVALPGSARDPGNAFREVLTSFGCTEINVGTAFRLFNAPHARPREAVWSLKLVCVAIAEGQTDLLHLYPCFRLDNGEWRALQHIDTADEWLSVCTSDKKLSRLGLVKVLDTGYLTEDGWMDIETLISEKFNFNKTVSATDLLTALASRPPACLFRS